jgi:hypothetical protein
VYAVAFDQKGLMAGSTSRDRRSRGSIPVGETPTFE